MTKHHAYFYAGDLEEGIAAASAFGEQALSLSESNPDVVVLRHGLFSVEDARLIGQLSSRAPKAGDAKLIIIATGRLFHEAQNALLKTFEEPAPGTFLVLVVPSEGNIISTLRSRLLPLPESGARTKDNKKAQEFFEGSEAIREKIVEEILDRAKSDDAGEKQEARLEALRLAEGLMRIVHALPKKTKAHEALLQDLSRLVPILHERSAPLKPILEHLFIVLSGR